MSPLLETSSVAPTAAVECSLVSNVALIGLIAVGTWYGIKKLLGRKE
jgi:hypothetical protein